MPNGIEKLGVNCPLIIEIKASVLLSSFFQQEKVAQKWLNSNSKGEYWVIYQTTHITIPKGSTSHFKLLSIDELARRLKDEVYAPLCLRKDLSKNLLRRINQTELINKAKRALIENNCTIVLGAGISIDAGAKVGMTF